MHKLPYYSLYDTHLQGIMVVLFIILDRIFVFTNTTTVIPCRRVSQRELASRPLHSFKFKKKLNYSDLHYCDHKAVSTT